MRQISRSQFLQYSKIFRFRKPFLRQLNNYELTQMYVNVQLIFVNTYRPYTLFAFLTFFFIIWHFFKQFLRFEFLTPFLTPSLKFKRFWWFLEKKMYLFHHFFRKISENFSKIIQPCAFFCQENRQEKATKKTKRVYYIIIWNGLFDIPRKRSWKVLEIPPSRQEWFILEKTLRLKA